jgi:1,4-dihydroxy-6-naphthoate synthase
VSTRLSLGYSPCPNDTFIFHALTHGLIESAADLEFVVLLDDVEALNRSAAAGRLDVAKVSYHAYGHISSDYVMLRSGGALGRGVGPLVVARTPGLDLRGKRVAVPGGRTTAKLLLELWRPEGLELEELRYDAIIPAVAGGEVDAGLIIHESRFTYMAHGLHALVDLGAWWEGEVGELVPLGAIVARRSLGAAMHTRLAGLVRASLEYAWRRPGASTEYVAANAQEMSEEVRRQHIALYVNDYSLDVGVDGERAARRLLERGLSRGLFPALREPIFAA